MVRACACEVVNRVVAERRQMYDRYGIPPMNESLIIVGAAYLEPDFEPGMFAPQSPFGQPGQPYQVPIFQYPQPIPKPFRPQFMHRASASSYSSAYSSERSAAPTPPTVNTPASFYPYYQAQTQYSYAAQPPTPGPSYPSTPISGYSTGYTTPMQGVAPQPTPAPASAPSQGHAPPPQFRPPPYPPTQPMYYASPPTSPPLRYMTPVPFPPGGEPFPQGADYFSRGPPPPPVWGAQPPPAPMSSTYKTPPSAPVSRSPSYSDIRPTPQRAWTEQGAGINRDPQAVPRPKRKGWFGF